MSLVGRAHVKLAAPLGRYLKESRGRAHELVPVRRLLTHSAGLPATPPAGSVSPGFPKAATLLAKLPFDYPPGSSFQYSDTGFILLGEMVRRGPGAPPPPHPPPPRSHAPGARRHGVQPARARARPRAP